MAKTETVTKLDFIKQINEKWKKEQQCYDDAKVEGKDSRTGKKTTISWPRDKPIEQTTWESWLQKVTDPDIGKFCEQRDKNGNTIKGTGPKYLVKTIVRIRTNDGSEFLYSKGRVTGFDVIGDVVSQKCNEPETWTKVGFAYDKKFNQNTMSMKQTLVGPNSRETVYDMSFDEKNLKTLFDKRIDDNISFVVKDSRMARDVRDATGIASKTLELMMTKPFDYLYNSDYISAVQKAELRQQAIEMGLLPREAQAPSQPATAPPKGTYG
jgi:hypothetical protein